ncbi:hypothetical protein COCCU_02670 [Corynebacterium occultum]|uniref:Uncharacterized protein n=1 Tax=Corynebacterium occultum TaxID=2675219 RepID=A0A6B8WJ23_9CORY|nr:hypothetical protein [Corynebacterium occultum]QGU06488.1 hypothetical protein COCCU_02670 [Corynebacterium occultum]
MRLSKISQGIIAAVIVIWIICLAALVINAAGKNDVDFPAKGALERNVTALDEQGLQLSALSMADIYGEEYVAGSFICPGATTESINQSLEVDAGELNLGAEGVPAGSSYLLLRTADGAAHFDEVDIDTVDFCSQPLEGYFNTYDLMPLGKYAEGGWALLF